MSAAEVERFRRAYERFNETGELVFDRFHLDIEWLNFAEAPYPELHGRAQVEQWYASMREALGHWRAEMDEFLDAGEGRGSRSDAWWRGSKGARYR